MKENPGFDSVLHFWFTEIDPARHWQTDSVFDQHLRERFGSLHRAAVQGELSSWRAKPAGRLAEVIVLDQFSRNIHRGTPQAFAADAMALALAQEAVSAGHDLSLPPERRVFFYMPYMHSESVHVHRMAVPLFNAVGLSLDFELRHKAIIERFGRYPHRNRALGRPSTEAECQFLREPGSSF